MNKYKIRSLCEKMWMRIKKQIYVAGRWMKKMDIQIEKTVVDETLSDEEGDEAYDANGESSENEIEKSEIT